MKTRSPLLEKAYRFSIRVVKVYRTLTQQEKEYSLSRQLLKSATSIGANAEEAQGGQSRRDFIAKIQIAYKEARETHYWLRILRDTQYLDPQEANSLITDCEELLRILVSILKSSKKRK